MTLQELHTRLVSKKMDHVYMFTGEEIGIMNIYINQISKLSGMKVHRVDSFSEAYTSIKKQSMVKQNFVYVIRDDKEVTENEKVQELLGQASWKDIVILLFTSLDKRTKFYKQYKDRSVEFEHLKAENLVKYIQKEIKLSNGNAILLAEVCECDYSRILLEIDKIKQCMVAVKAEDMPNNIFEMLLADGTIYQPPKDAIFDWCDAMMKCSKKAFDLYDQSLKVGKASLPLLTVLYNNIKQTLQVETCTSKDISKSTGLTGWQIQCGKKYVGTYSDSELKQYLRLIREMEVGIKTGKIEEEMTVLYVMFSMLGGY